MGRPRNPQRDLSLQRYLEADGKISIKELSEMAGVPENRMRKWKSEDKWNEALEQKPRKRGGQKGNKNAAGKTPAKAGNKNAVTHGAFAQAGYGDIPQEKADEIKNIKEARAMPHMIEELQSLYVRKAYLENLLKEYESPKEGRFYTDKIVHMIMPKGKGSTADPENIGDTGNGQQEEFKTMMKSVVKSSPFDRAMKVEAELNKLHGRIIKQIDSIKAYEMEERRLQLEEKRLELTRQKITGEIDLELEEEGMECLDEP
ncbi:MAG: phage terminase small subunit-related protein [Roseburia sp.]|nr:phage terminase small subunit-related protein [Roseburia sp.]